VRLGQASQLVHKAKEGTAGGDAICITLHGRGYPGVETNAAASTSLWLLISVFGCSDCCEISKRPKGAPQQLSARPSQSSEVLFAQREARAASSWEVVCGPSKQAAGPDVMGSGRVKVCEHRLTRNALLEAHADAA